MPVAWGRWTSPGGLQRQRRFEGLRKRAFGLTLPTVAARLQGIAESEPPAFLAQLQQAAFQQRPEQIRPPTDLRSLALGFAGPQGFETPQQQLARGAQAARSFASSIQELEPPEITMLRRLAGFSERQGISPQQVVQQAQAPSIPQGAPQAPLPAPVTDDVGEALQRVLEVNRLSAEEYNALSSEQRVRAIGQLLQEPFPGVSNSAIQQLVAQERVIEPGVAGRLVRGTGQFALEALEEERKQVQPFTRPALERLGEVAERGGLGPAPQLAGLAGAPVKETVETAGAEVLLPSNLIPIPLIEPAAARLLATVFKVGGRAIAPAIKTGERVTRDVLARLGREAATQAADETLPHATRVGLDAFAREVEQAARLTPGETAEVGALTGLPSRADVAAPTQPGPAQPGPAVPGASVPGPSQTGVPVRAELPEGGLGAPGTMERLGENIRQFDRNAQEARLFIRDSLEPAFEARYGDAPVMNMKQQFPGGGEPLVEIRTAGWRDRAKELGLEFVREEGFGDLYRLPTAKLGPGAEIALPAPARAVEPGAAPAVRQAAPAPPGDLVEPEALRAAGVEEAAKAQQARPEVVGGAAEAFVTPLRGLDEVAGEVVTSSNRLVRGMVGRTGVNPAVLVEDDVGRLLVAFERQRGASESLTNVAVAASYDVHASRFTGRGPFPIKNGNIAGKRWEDVLSNDALIAKMDDGAQAAARDYQRAIEEVEFLRVQAGLRPRATSGPASVTEGWHYVPRQVEGVRGIEIRRPSSPNLGRIFDEASEGAQRGIDYSNDPRANLELHIRAAYNEIAQKQLTDSLEPLSITAKDLVPVKTLKQMSDATVQRIGAERTVRNLQNELRRAAPQGRAEVQKAQAAAERAQTRLAGTQDVGRAQEVLPELEAARAEVPATRARTVAQRKALQGQVKAAQAQLDEAMIVYRTAKTKYSNALKTAQRKEVAPGELFGIEAPEIPIATWRNRFFPREQADALNEALGSFLRPGQTANWPGQAFEVLGNHIRFLSAVGDFAAPVIQGLPLLARDPVAWSRATLRHYQAFVDPTVMARHMRDNLSVYQEMASFNVPVGDVEVFAILKEGKGIPIGRVLELLPKGKAAREALQQGGKQTFGRFQASYDTFLGMARVELWKGLKPGWKGSLDDLAAHVRNMTGGLDSRALGVGPTQRGFESTWLAFSPRLLRSTVALVSDLRLGVRNARGREAWRTLSTLAGAITGVYVASGLALGKSWEEIRAGLNPLEGKKFLSHEVNGDWVGAGGQFRAITQLLVRSAADPASLVGGDQFENPVLSFLAGRGAPGLRIGQALVEFATGADALPFDTVDSLPSLVAHLAESALPFAVQGKLEGESWPTTGFAMVGARTSPGTSFENIREFVNAQRPGQETPDESVLSLAREMANSGDEEAARLVQEFEASGASAGTEGAQRRGALAGEVSARVEETGLRGVAQDALAGNIEASAQFGREYDDLRRDRAIISQFQARGADFPEPSSDLGKLVDEFYEIQPTDIRDPETQAPDFTAWRAARRAVLDEIKVKDAGLARTIDQQPIFSPDDEPELAQLERSYLAAKKVDSQLNEISPAEGLHVVDYEEVRAFLVDVQEVRRRWTEETGDPGELAPAIAALGEQAGKSAPFIEWAQALRGAVPDELRNPAYDQFLIQHQAELRPFFPELYRSQRILRQLFDNSQQPALAGVR